MAETEITGDDKVAFERKFAFPLFQILKNLDTIWNVVDKPDLVGRVEAALRQTVGEELIRELTIDFITKKRGASALSVIRDKRYSEVDYVSTSELEWLRRDDPQKLIGRSFLFPARGGPEKNQLLMYILFVPYRDEVAEINLVVDWVERANK
jgi:hypothetical protein